MYTKPRNSGGNLRTRTRIHPELIQIIVNEDMKQERQKYLSVGTYQRDEDVRDMRMGTRIKHYEHEWGEIKFDIPSGLIICSR